jgi:hypothetical protein
MAVEFYSPPDRGAAFSTRGARLIAVKFPQARKAIRIGSHKKPSGPDRDALRNDARPRLRAIVHGRLPIERANGATLAS